MANQVTLAASPRTGNGKGEARALRRDGRVPAIAYGTDLDPTPISVDQLELYHALHTDAGVNAILKLDLGGDQHLALAREIQRDPVRRTVLHVDFVTVSRNVKVSVEVPIHLEGVESSPASSEGGVVSLELYTLPIEVLPLEVPDQIVVDVSELGVTDQITVADLKLPSGVEAQVDAETTVVTVLTPEAAEPATTEGVTEGADGAQAAGATAEEAGAADGVGDSDS